jgi:hypothetical protein
VADALFGTLYDENETRGINRRQHGVFGLHPLATPKYAFNKGARDNEFKESLARMYVSLAEASEQLKQQYLASLPGDAQTQALAKVLTGAGQQKGGTGFIDFFLQQVNESWQEAVQVDKVLGDNYVAFYFGQEPPIFQYTGTLLNSQQDDQRSGFALAYQHILRGTQLARRNALLRLKYDNVIVSGTMNSHSQALNAENEMVVPFSFSLLVKEYVVLSNPRFTKKSQSDFIQLATQFASGELGPVGRVSDVRVRSIMVQPNVSSAESSAGIDEPDPTIDATVTAPEQLSAKINEYITRETRP